MKFTLNWLKEFLETNASLDEICSSLTDIGLEVEEIINPGKELAQFEVASVLKTEKHPDADRLNICEIETSSGKVSLVCGAANVRAGLKVAYAPIGSIIPANGMEIKKAKIRGIESSGMLCSSAELSLGENSEGIMELDENSEIGCKINDLLNLNDVIIEIAITPNRGDALSVYGIARDLAAAGIGTLKTLEAREISPKFKSNININCAIEEVRQFYILELRDLENKQAPKWLKERLEAIGVKSHSAIVDVTNYMCHGFGQPMHAYAKDKVSGDFILRKAQNGEKFISLDKKEYKLTSEDVVISDAEKINGLAGIIGGDYSSTSINETSIYLEAAEFDHINISKTGRKHQIITDSRFRFEREIDHSKVRFYLSYAANLIQEICGGEVSDIIAYNENKKQAIKISFPFTKISKYLGISLTPEKVSNILEKLGCTDILATQETVELTAPLFRNDLSEPHDIIEEIARLNNLNNIPNIPFSHQKLNETKSDNLFNYNILLTSLGLNEVVNYSFIGEEEALRFAQKSELLEISNPISIDLKFMRPSLLPSLLKNLQARQNRSIFSVKLFEIGTIFKKQDDDAMETISAATLRSGPRSTKEVNNDSSNFDIYDSKNDLFSILEEAGLPSERVKLVNSNLPDFMHPGRSAAAYLGKNLIGYFGEMHPKICSDLGLKHRVNFAEVLLSNIPTKKTKKAAAYTPNSIQSLNRDFSFIVDSDLNSGDVKNEIARISKPLVTDIFIFDEYKGDKLPQGKKSLAFNLLLQPSERDLTTNELEAFNHKIISHITTKFNASLP